MQKVWGVLIAHTLLRRWMRLMAQHAQGEPADQLPHCAARHRCRHPRGASGADRHLQCLLEQACYFVLPPHRANRSFPRVVKRCCTQQVPTKKMPARA